MSGVELDEMLRSVRIDGRVDDWLEQRSVDEGVSKSEIVRRALDREMVANPFTTDPGVNDEVVEYLRDRFFLTGNVVRTIVTTKDRL